LWFVVFLYLVFVIFVKFNLESLIYLIIKQNFHAVPGQMCQPYFTLLYSYSNVSKLMSVLSVKLALQQLLYTWKFSGCKYLVTNLYKNKEGYFNIDVISTSSYTANLTESCWFFPFYQYGGHETALRHQDGKYIIQKKSWFIKLPETNCFYAWSKCILFVEGLINPVSINPGCSQEANQVLSCYSAHTRTNTDKVTHEDTHTYHLAGGPSCVSV